MKTKKVNRYYCEFCSKSGCSAPHMVKHEKHCTANPNRECRMCQDAIKPHELISLIPDSRQYERMEPYDFLDCEPQTFTYLEFPQSEAKRVLALLREACGHCPACILAVIRQSGTSLDLGFDYKEEVKAHWASVGAAVQGFAS